MTSLNLHSHRTQLIATAVAASVTTAGLLYSYQNLSRHRRRKELDAEIRRAIVNHNESTGRDSPDIFIRSLEDESKVSTLRENPEYAEELVREQLARNYAFFGEEGMEKVRGGSVVVVGCGGVGSWAAVMLLRSGVSKIRLVDFDYVTLSSLNRHATATLSDVGTPKVKCVEKTLKDIAKWAQVDACVDIWRKEEGEKLLSGYDWVVDAIDNIQTKVDLLKYCHDNNIKVFSSMGAGAKCDPTRIHISDISYTVYDPLARSVRRRLRLQGVNGGIPVVYSSEVPGDVKLLPLPEEEFQKGPVKELGVFDDFRIRILPVLGPLPAIFGLNIASYIVCELAGKPISNPLPIKNRKKLYERIYRDLLHREEKLVGHQLNRLPIDEDDVGLIFEDLHRGRSVLPPYDVPTRPTLVRWDYSKPLTTDNCIVLEHKDAETHFKTCSGPEASSPSLLWGKGVEEIVNRRAEEARRITNWVM
ncbi:ubiquitin-protein ligase molybdopterin-converting factor [Coprinopsis marcescibilis]|uniref:Ubiquitin-protein ligase molybdopterin-converting factor n=1 Tax=Coprinopsis marcescibilis TaxID=230819 RepID=A0A5C3LAQ6_COPMA|nr:ubiquitin-protein ligase molybdopterin-converting factor [Coprinopsis marcescibilis]